MEGWCAVYCLTWYSAYANKGRIMESIFWDLSKQILPLSNIEMGVHMKTGTGVYVYKADSIYTCMGKGHMASASRETDTNLIVCENVHTLSVKCVCVSWILPLQPSLVDQVFHRNT